jgi:lipoprotein-releasing system permease protein
MLKLFLWLKYLRKKKIALLSIAAVAVSVAMLVVVSSLFIGFIKKFEQSAVKLMGDIVVTPPRQFAYHQQFLKELQTFDEVQAATGSLLSNGLLHLGKGNVRAVRILGIDPEARSKVTGLREFLLSDPGDEQKLGFDLPDAPGKVGGYVSIGVVTEPNEKTDVYAFEEVKAQTLGQQMVLTTGTGEKLKRRTMVFNVADIVFTGVYEMDKSYVYVPIDTLADELYPELEGGPVADQVQIKLKDGADEALAQAKIWGLWKVFAEEKLGWNEYLISSTSIMTSRQLQSQYIAELKKQLGLLILIFALVSLGAVLLVFCILYMIVEMRLKDIAIIKSCGANNSSVGMIFLGFGSCIGLVGAALGTLLGGAVIRNINTIEEWIRIAFGLKLWRSSTYMFSVIPNELDLASAFYISLCAVLAASVGALVPAIVAARTRPVEILRFE